MQPSECSLEPLREDEEFVLYRSCHRNRGEPTSILLLVPVLKHAALETLEKINHEYALRSELDTSWAVRPRDLSQYNGKTVLELEDPGGEPLHRLIHGAMEINQFLCLAVGLTTALTQLHQRVLIHKDLKPSNVLADAATGHVRLTGFGIASRLPRERQSPEPPEFIAGTLAYMAPEQTGRMNRSIDSRSDLYALGVTLYEMVTGSLPFTASDPMEWVHCHMARQPMPPSERLNHVPRAVSAIIMKLLAKTAEERYQTATGVENDLRRCLAEWETQRRIDEFSLGEHDTPDRLLMPEKLYGREADIETLVNSFDRIVRGNRPELVLVSGYSGIGKSSVVNELHKALVPPRGVFASGKFDQYKRDIPYATLAQAFQSLARLLLTKSEEELRKWREALHDALDPNGQLIVELVPELKLILGEQPPVPELPSQDAQRRWQLVFRRFISVFARPEHPLALFLDDLQWLDAATLDLMEDLLTRPDVRDLMLIGAYRDNEVNPAHPLMRKLEAMRQGGAMLQEIVLAPLTREDLGRLIADSLDCEPARAVPLAQLIHGKTAGNPFFVIQFISALAEEGLLAFDHDQGRWSWDLDRIHAKRYTDNVVDFMVRQLNCLPVQTQSALQQLACLGNRAEFTLLRTVFENSNEEMHGHFWEAVRLGFIFRSDDSYSFVHDRVQEAAYSLIPDEVRAEAHLRIGKLLAADTDPEKLEDRIFEIVNQLNRGSALMTSRDEREHLAELNLIAGKRAKTSAAYASALNYLIAGSALLADDSWVRLHELTFHLELNRAECEFLNGQLAAAQERLSLLTSRTANAVELATVTSLLIDVYTAHDQSDRAVAVCLDYLRHLGTEWSPHPTQEEAEREYERMWSLLGSRKIEELIQLPIMSDAQSLATLDVLTKVLPPALFTDKNLLSLAICRAVNVSLERGNSDASCVAYEWLGQIAGAHFGNYKAAFRFGELGYELVEKRGLKRFQARTYMVFGSHVMPWAKHIRAGRDLIRRTFEVANKIGDLCFAVYSCINLNTNFLAAGDPLVEAQREAENGLKFAQKARFGWVIDTITAQVGLIRTLRNLTQNFGSFDDGDFEELRFERHLASDPVLAQPECLYWIRKLQARFLAGDYTSALAALMKAEPLLWTSPSNLELAEYHLYGALCRATSWDGASPDQKPRHFEALAAHHRQLEIWAENCPENFANRAALVSAEIARIQGRPLDAEHLYEQAIRSAHANGFIHIEALANEFAARFYEARGFDKIADAYLREARYGYLRWGATGKVRQLDELYPQLTEERPLASSRSAPGASIEQLDLATVVKISQAVSGEIVLEKLIDTLMRTALEHAGAQRGLLILPRGDELTIEAEATARGGTVVVRLRGASVAPVGMPESIVRYVVRSKESVILDDASAQNPFSADAYVRQHRARSVLCLPLLKQARLIGLLYLENSLTGHVFTPTRISVLKLLASQAAVFLENTRLYTDLEEREAKIRRLVSANILGIFFYKCSKSDCEITEANEAFLNMLQHDREDLASGRMRWMDLTPPEWRDRDKVAHAELMANGSVQPFEKEYLRKDGSRLPVLVGGALFKEGGDEGVGFALDLTEQKRTEDALRGSEERWRAVFENSAIGVALMDSDGYFIAANSAYQRMVGYSEEELRSLTFLELTHEDYRQANLKQIEELKNGTKAQFQIDKQFKRKDGSLLWVRVNVSLVPGSERMTQFIMALAEDIAERKNAEEALELQNNRLQIAQAELARVSRLTTMGELAASIAHEINQPLTAITNNSSACLRLLAGRNLDPEVLRHALETIVADGTRASAVISRIRTLIKKAPAERSELDVNQVIQEVLALTGRELHENRVLLERQFTKPLPPVLADRVQLQQVLLNLIMNGIEAMSAVADRPRLLRVHSQIAERGNVLVAVCDSGTGLGQDVDRVFAPFFTTKANGMGMGLSISRSLIEDHGGRLWASPNSPHGSVFCFTLPLASENVSCPAVL